jgi:hypothetical protein
MANNIVKTNSSDETPDQKYSDHDLIDYEDGSVIRPATNAEYLASTEAAKRDSGRGVITVIVGGYPMPCYVL